MNCKNCRWWRNSRYCERVDQSTNCAETSKEPVLEPKSFLIEWSTSDESGLDLRLVTGPDFGCVQFQAK